MSMADSQVRTLAILHATSDKDKAEFQVNPQTFHRSDRANWHPSSLLPFCVSSANLRHIQTYTTIIILCLPASGHQISTTQLDASITSDATRRQLYHSILFLSVR